MFRIHRTFQQKHPLPEQDQVGNHLVIRGLLVTILNHFTACISFSKPAASKQRTRQTHTTIILY